MLLVRGQVSLPGINLIVKEESVTSRVAVQYLGVHVNLVAALNNLHRCEMREACSSSVMSRTRDNVDVCTLVTLTFAPCASKHNQALNLCWGAAYDTK